VRWTFCVFLPGANAPPSSTLKIDTVDMTFIGIPFLTGGKGSPIFLTQSMHNTKAQKWILSVAPETSLHKASQLMNLHDIAQQSYYCLQDLAVRPSSKSETVLLTHKMILLVSMEFFCL
jgi:hypothetical protein